MRAQVDGVGTGCGYLVAGFLPGPVLQLVVD